MVSCVYEKEERKCYLQTIVLLNSLFGFINRFGLGSFIRLFGFYRNNMKLVKHNFLKLSTTSNSDYVLMKLSYQCYKKQLTLIWKYLENKSILGKCHILDDKNKDFYCLFNLLQQCISEVYTALPPFTTRVFDYILVNISECTILI